MEAACSSKMTVDFHQTTRHYISEDRTLQQRTSIALPKLLIVLVNNSVFTLKVFLFTDFVAIIKSMCITDTDNIKQQM
jgi:hypothetical protein